MRSLSVYHWFLALSFLAVWVWALVNPVFPHDWLLENYLVFLFVPAILWYSRHHRLSNASYGFITIFMMLHVVGSHYTYAYVPFGFTLQVWLHESRNMYDRLVHFLFGLLLFYPIQELLARWAKVAGSWNYFFTFVTITATAALYEIIEWFTASIVAPAAAMAYLGSQGDLWDAHKDIWLAIVGAFLAMGIILVNKKWYASQKSSK